MTTFGFETRCFNRRQNTGAKGDWDATATTRRRPAKQDKGGQAARRFL